jgi:phosphoenolpyruvate carboxykinase (ATP)
LHPLVYAELLKEKMKKFNVPAFLVNTGWVGSNASSGSPRISLPITRKIIHKILDGTIQSCNFEKDALFGFHIPTTLDDIDSNLLLPKNIWGDEKDYLIAAKDLIDKFQDNFSQYEIDDEKIKNAAPSYN